MVLLCSFFVDMALSQSQDLHRQDHADAAEILETAKNRKDQTHAYCTACGEKIFNYL